MIKIDACSAAVIKIFRFKKEYVALGLNAEQSASFLRSRKPPNQKPFS
jgi:hypothetical protein